MDTEEMVTALTEGRAFADLSPWRKVEVGGRDAMTWLNDLLSADLEDLRPGRARASLLLSPTGRIRADVTVAVTNGAVVLLQDPAQPRAIGDLLAPYVLSSDVELEDRTDAVAVFGFPGSDAPPDAPGTTSSAPSSLKAGVDLLAPAADRDRTRSWLERGSALASPEDLEAWRIWSGIARFGVDGTEDDLPQEAGLEQQVAFDKGCYLGQETMAKVRNLGHPRRVLLPLTADGIVSRGEAVLAHGDEAGIVTSAAVVGGRTGLMARVRWEARGVPLRTASGRELALRSSIVPS